MLDYQIDDYCCFMASLLHAYNKLIWWLKHLRVAHNNNWMINALCMLMEDLVAVLCRMCWKSLLVLQISSIITHCHVASALFDAGKPWWICKSLVVHQIVHTIQNFKLSCDINKESKQAEISPKFYYPKVCDGKFAKVFPCQQFALYCSSFYWLKYNEVHALIYQIMLP